MKTQCDRFRIPIVKGSEPVNMAHPVNILYIIVTNHRKILKFNEQCYTKQVSILFNKTSPWVVSGFETKKSTESFARFNYHRPRLLIMHDVYLSGLLTQNNLL